MVFRNNYKLANLLGSAKDKIETLQKSGIYSIQCADCDQIYVGQTKRNIGTRFKEHTACIRNNQPNKSAVAYHALENIHFNIGVNNLQLLKQVNDDKKLDAYECYYIQNNKNNTMNGNIDSCLFAIISKTEEENKRRSEGEDDE